MATKVKLPAPAPVVKPPTITVPDAYKEGPFQKGPASQFGLMKKQAESRLSGAETQGRDAINRRLASLGNLNSGSAFKLEQNMQNDLNRQREESLGGIDIAAAQDETAREQAFNQRQMQGNQFDRTFAEQQRGSQFMEGIAGEEHDLSKMNTLLNSAMALESVKKPQDVINYFDSFSKSMPGSVPADLTKALKRRFNTGGGRYIGQASTMNYGGGLGQITKDKKIWHYKRKLDKNQQKKEWVDCWVD